MGVSSGRLWVPEDLGQTEVRVGLPGWGEKEQPARQPAGWPEAGGAAEGLLSAGQAVEGPQQEWTAAPGGEGTGEKPECERRA